ncbi:MAG: TIGR04283 family arsenosugar biosynthesis glycosyltransferase [Pseudomonadota bacterium]|nr:TIGR04283 family arsenosugar biosynthesis glycosyltransferase [Pseudomonadota bacterium]
MPLNAPISVIIPCLNEALVCTRRLEALQSLRNDGHELVLVDGGSTDGTADLARPWVDRLLTSAPGRAIQMNRGAGAASGEVLWFLHLDTELPPGAAEQVLHAALGGPGWGRFDVRLSGDAPMFRVIERSMNLKSRLSGIATGDQGIFVHRRLFERVGGFPEIALMEDIAVSRRLKRLARPACLRVRLVASSRRWERDGIWRTVLLMWSLRAAYRLGADPAWLARLYYPCASPMRVS